MRAEDLVNESVMDLLEAILIQARRDYISCLRTKDELEAKIANKKYKSKLDLLMSNKYTNEKRIKDLENFFNTSPILSLANIEGDYVIRVLKSAYKEGIYN